MQIDLLYLAKNRAIHVMLKLTPSPLLVCLESGPRLLGNAVTSLRQSIAKSVSLSLPFLLNFWSGISQCQVSRFQRRRPPLRRNGRNRVCMSSLTLITADHELTAGYFCDFAIFGAFRQTRCNAKNTVCVIVFFVLRCLFQLRPLRLLRPLLAYFCCVVCLNCVKKYAGTRVASFATINEYSITLPWPRTSYVRIRFVL